MVRPTLIDLNPVEYYSYIINLDKCNGSYNVLSQKICVPKEENKIQMLKYLIKLRQQKKHISCDCKCKFNSTTCNSNQKWNNKRC